MRFEVKNISLAGARSGGAPGILGELSLTLSFMSWLKSADVADADHRHDDRLGDEGYESRPQPDGDFHFLAAILSSLVA